MDSRSRAAQYFRERNEAIQKLIIYDADINYTSWAEVEKVITFLKKNKQDYEILADEAPEHRILKAVIGLQLERYDPAVEQIIKKDIKNRLKINDEMEKRKALKEILWSVDEIDIGEFSKKQLVFYAVRLSYITQKTKELQKRKRKRPMEANRREVRQDGEVLNMIKRAVKGELYPAGTSVRDRMVGLTQSVLDIYGVGTREAFEVMLKSVTVLYIRELLQKAFDLRETGTPSGAAGSVTNLDAANKAYELVFSITKQVKYIDDDYYHLRF